MHPTPELSVRRLRVVGACAERAGLRRATVEDALRIASRPTALEHRLVLVRRLSIRLAPQAGAQSLALQLEREWLALAARAQPIEVADAGAAAVWAVDVEQALLALLTRWLSGADAGAWFWQRLCPAAASPLLPWPQRIEPLLAAPLLDGMPLQRRQGFEREARRRVAAALPLEAWRVRAVVAASPPLAVLPAGLAWPDAPVDPTALTADGAGPLEASAQKPPSTPIAGLQRPAAEGAQALRDAESAATPTVAPTRPPAAGRQVDANAPRGGEERLTAPAEGPRRATAAEPATPPAASIPAAASVPHATAHAAAPAEPATPRWPTLQGLSSAWAGLLLLLPVLQRESIDAEPAPAALLAGVLRRAAAAWPLDAGARAWIEPLQGTLPPCDAASADDWWRRARRASALRARLPLLRLARRPGVLWLAPHRVDVSFALAGADVRIRRAGFDIDPGYLPWLDTVVHFHYDR